MKPFVLVVITANLKNQSMSSILISYFNSGHIQKRTSTKPRYHWSAWKSTSTGEFPARRCTPKLTVSFLCSDSGYSPPKKPPQNQGIMGGYRRPYSQLYIGLSGMLTKYLLSSDSYWELTVMSIYKKNWIKSGANKRDNL
jgi:hypothetical protein